MDRISGPWISATGREHIYMKRKYVSAYTFGGSTAEDTFEQTLFLKEGDSYAITDIPRTIAESIVASIAWELPDVKETMEYITKCIRNNQDFKLMSDKTEEDSDTVLSFSANSLTLYSRIHWGECETTTIYEVHEIADVNVLYAATEQFLSPTETCTCYERIYRFPNESLEEAQAELKRISEFQRKDCGAIRRICSIIVLDDTSRSHMKWIADNGDVISFLARHPELDTDENFHIFPKRHLEKLKKARAK